MEGVIVNYRRGRKTQTTNQMVVLVPGYDKKKAESLIGKTVSFVCEGKNKTTITGKVTALHGNKGAVRVLFERGMPGQAIGGKVSIN
jgi:large subunit ribosomal protein L35Ae